LSLLCHNHALLVTYRWFLDDRRRNQNFAK